MITLKYADIIFTLNSSQEVSCDNSVSPEIKEFLNEQIEVMVKTSKDSYSVSDGFFETYLANNLKKVFEIIEIKEEELTETEERIY